MTEEYTLLLPLTKQEFRNAKMGKVVQKRFQGKDKESYCVLISNRFISPEESRVFISQGLSVLPIDITGVGWRELDSKFKSNLQAEYSNGLTIALISQSIFHQLVKEREEEGGNPSD
jgi:hypothetical protein